MTGLPSFMAKTLGPGRALRCWPGPDRAEPQGGAWSGLARGQALGSGCVWGRQALPACPAVGQSTARRRGRRRRREEAVANGLRKRWQWRFLQPASEPKNRERLKAAKSRPNPHPPRSGPCQGPGPHTGRSKWEGNSRLLRTPLRALRLGLSARNGAPLLGLGSYPGALLEVTCTRSRCPR